MSFQRTNQKNNPLNNESLTHIVSGYCQCLNVVVTHLFACGKAHGLRIFLYFSIPDIWVSLSGLQGI
jgi:hypothetical protein